MNTNTKQVVKFSPEESNVACSMVEQRLNALGVVHANELTTSVLYSRLLEFCKSHGITIRDYPVTVLAENQHIKRIWSGVFDINELISLL